jgi:hypothetical protein
MQNEISYPAMPPMIARFLFPICNLPLRLRDWQAGLRFGKNLQG